MKIYTSYFGNLKNVRNAGIIPISIARYTPKWYIGLKDLSVAPTHNMLSEDMNREEYIKCYNRIFVQ